MYGAIVISEAELFEQMPFTGYNVAVGRTVKTLTFCE